MKNSETTRRFRLRDLFLNQLQVICASEKALMETLTKMDGAAAAAELKKVFEQKRIDERLIRIAEQHVNSESIKQPNRL